MFESHSAPNEWRQLAFAQSARSYGLQRIVCLTEEQTQWLYFWSEERRVVDISGYTVRLPRTRELLGVSSNTGRFKLCRPAFPQFVGGKAGRMQIRMYKLLRGHCCKPCRTS
jgi:hypothetical protein